MLEAQEIELDTSSHWGLWTRFALTLLAIFAVQTMLMTLVMRYDFYKLVQVFAHQWVATVIAYTVFYYIFHKNIKLARN